MSKRSVGYNADGTVGWEFFELLLTREGALEWRTGRQVRDLAELKGEGGVVNIGRKPVEVKDAHHGHDSHGHDDAHSGAAH